MNGPWRTWGICPCGAYADAPFGDLFHIHFDGSRLCPRCGRDIEKEWKVIKGREVTRATKRLLGIPLAWETTLERRHDV